MATILDYNFLYMINHYFRGKRFENILPKYYDGILLSNSEIPKDIDIYTMQQVKYGLTKENLNLFIEWYQNERQNKDIGEWKMISDGSGRIETNFGYVNFQVNINNETIIICIN
jgi:hypothetical protein